MATSTVMTAQEVLQQVAAMPQEDLMKIQNGIADLILARFSSEEVREIREALAESEAEYKRGETVSSEDARRRFGLL